MTSSDRELELRIAGWGALAFGALLASYAVFRPVRDALVLDGHPDDIPWLFTATFLGMLVASPLWSAALDRVGRRRLVPIAFHVFAACALGFAVAVAAELAPAVVGRVFYVWASVFVMFVVSVFWSLLADLLGPERARRLFGPIAAGGTIGAIAGPALTRLLVEQLRVEGLLVVSTVLLELAVLAIAQVRRAGEAFAVVAPAPEPPAPRGGPFAGLVQLARSPYLRSITGYVLCTATAATFLYLEQADLVHAELPDRDARAALFATIDLWASAGALVLQTLIAAPLLRRVGPGVVMVLLPLAQLAGVSLVVLAPSIGVLVFAQIGSRALTHGLTRPARELLFTTLDPDAKYRAKNAIDTVGYRCGDVASSWLHGGAVAVAGTGALVVTLFPIAAVWIALAFALGAQFRRRTTKETR